MNKFGKRFSRKKIREEIKFVIMFFFFLKIIVILFSFPQDNEIYICSSVSEELISFIVFQNVFLIS